MLPTSVQASSHEWSVQSIQASGGSAARSSVAPRVVTVPVSVDPSGKTDVSAALQRFIDAIPDGSTILFQKRGRYRIDTGIRLDGRHHLVFDGQGAILSSRGCSPTNSPFVLGWWTSSSYITITRFTLQGNNPDTGTNDTYHSDCEGQMGVAIYHSTHVDIAAVTIRRVYGDCVYLGDGSAPGVWSTAISVGHSRCIGTGRSGVAITAASDVFVHDTSFSEIGMYVLNIEANASNGGGTYVRFGHNRVGTYGLTKEYDGNFVDTNGAPGAAVHHIAVTRNVVTRETLSTRIQMPGTHDVVFSYNTSIVPSPGPVVAAFDNVDHVTVAHNVQPLKSGQFAWFRNSTNVVYVP
jgi:hypothetical protein